MDNKLVEFLSKPECLMELENEELVSLYEKIRYSKEELETAEKVIKEEFINNRVKNKYLQVGNYVLTKRITKRYKTDIETARSFGAIKEEIDESLIKKLAEAGANIPNLEVNEFASLLIRFNDESDK